MSFSVKYEIIPNFKNYCTFWDSLNKGYLKKNVKIASLMTTRLLHQFVPRNDMPKNIRVFLQQSVYGILYISLVISPAFWELYLNVNELPFFTIHLT